MRAIDPNESLRLTGEAEVTALLHELGLSDWPSHHEDEGVLIRAVAHHETHWLAFVCVVAGDSHDWFAFGFPKSTFSRELSEEILEATTEEFGATGPFFAIE